MRRRFSAAMASVLLLAAPAISALPWPGVARLPADLVAHRATTVRAHPSPSAPVLARIAPGTIVRVVGVDGAWARVESLRNRPDGFVRVSDVAPRRRAGEEPADTARDPRQADPEPSRTSRVARTSPWVMVSPTWVYYRPSLDSPKIATLRKGDTIPVIDHRGNWIRIRRENAEDGFVPRIAAEPVR